MTETAKLTPEEEAEMEKDLKEFKEEVASLYATDEYFKLCIDSLGMWCQTYDSLCSLTEDADKLDMILEGYSSITLGICQIIQERYGFHALDTDFLLTDIEENGFWGVFVPETEPTYKEHLEADMLRNSQAIVNRILGKTASKKSA